jgi:hypothetical protein
MVCKYSLPFHVLPFHVVDCFLHCAETLKFCLCFGTISKNKIIAKNKVKELFPYFPGVL